MVIENLNWKKQISILSAKLRCANGALAKLRHYMTQKTLILVYYAIFHSHLFYSSQIWGQIYNTTTKRILTLQKIAVRIMTNSSRCEHAKPLFAKLKIVEVFDLVKCQNVLFLQRILNKNVPDHIQSMFELDGHSHNTRSNVNTHFIIPSTNTISFGTYSIESQCLKVWNYFSELFLNCNIVTISPNALKKKITDHFFNNYVLT